MFKNNNNLQDLRVVNKALTISTNTNTDSNLVLMKDVMSQSFSVYCNARTDGNYVVKMFVCNESDKSDAVEVVAPELDGTIPTISAVSTVGSVLNSVSIMQPAKYQFLRIVSTGVTTGASFDIYVVQDQAYKS